MPVVAPCNDRKIYQAVTPLIPWSSGFPKSQVAHSQCVRVMEGMRNARNPAVGLTCQRSWCGYNCVDFGLSAADVLASNPAANSELSLSRECTKYRETHKLETRQSNRQSNSTN